MPNNDDKIFVEVPVSIGTISILKRACIRAIQRERIGGASRYEHSRKRVKEYTECLEMLELWEQG